MTSAYNPRRCIDWKKLCAPPKRPKPRPPSEWEQLRPIHRISWAWRWPTFGPFVLRNFSDADFYRSRWLHGTREDPASFVEELPTDPEYHDTYRDLLRRHAAGEPELQGEMAELHLRRMAEIVAEAESP